MNRRSVSGGQQFNIRGYGNGVEAQTAPAVILTGKAVQFTFNGIPITDAEGNTVLDDIDFNSKRRSCKRTGVALLYGSRYCAGVVNLGDHEARKRKSVCGQDVMIGNFGLVVLPPISRLAAKISLLVNYGNQSSDGFMPHNTSEKNFETYQGNSA